MGWVERNEQYGASVDVINIEVASDKRGITVFINEKAPKYPYDTDERVARKLVELGCTVNNIVSSNSSVISAYMEDRVFHKRVYSILKEDFEKIFGRK